MVKIEANNDSLYIYIKKTESLVGKFDVRLEDYLQLIS